MAYADAKMVHHLEPKNKAIDPVLSSLHAAVQEKGDEKARTSNKVKTMLDIAFNVEEEERKRESAAENLVVLARENAGAELLWNAGVLGKIIKQVGTGLFK